MQKMNSKLVYEAPRVTGVQEVVFEGVLGESVVDQNTDVTIVGQETEIIDIGAEGSAWDQNWG